MVFVCTADGKRHKAADLVCWRFLDGRRCVKHVELTTARGYQVVVVPIPPRAVSNSSSCSSAEGGAAQAQLVAHSGSSSVDHPSRGCSSTAAHQVGVQQPPASSLEARAALDWLVWAQKVTDCLSLSLPVLLDASSSNKPGSKFYKWERLGMPVRIEVGQQEVATGTVTMCLNPGLVQAVAGDQQVMQLLQPYSRNSAAMAATATATVQQDCMLAAATPSAETAPALCGTLQLEHGYRVASTIFGASSAVHTAGLLPLKLHNVPLAEVAAVCGHLLQAAPRGRASAAVFAGLLQQEQQQPQQLEQQQQHDTIPIQQVQQHRYYCHNNHCMPCPQQPQQWPVLLPGGCCNKLHLWPDTAANRRPCTHHCQHLLGLAKPCHCGVLHHASMAQLQAELQRQMAAAGQAVVSFSMPNTHTPAAHKKRANTTAKAGHAALARDMADDAAKDTTVGIFVTGIPVSCSAAAARQQLLAAFAPCSVCSVTVAAAGSSGSRCRGWARVIVKDAETAAAAMQALQHNLCVTPGSTPVTLSWCCGRADALFPHLPSGVRQHLRLDDVAAYSTTDGPTAAAMAQLLAALAVEMQPWQYSNIALQTRSSYGGSSSSSIKTRRQLSVADLTACAGGNSIAFLQHFTHITAVELDPDRADDLVHNLQAALQHHHQQQHHCCPCRCKCKQQQLNVNTCANGVAAAAAAFAPGTKCSFAFCPKQVPGLMVLQQQHQQQHQQVQRSDPMAAASVLAAGVCHHMHGAQQHQSAIGQVAVVCGEAVQLTPYLQQQDVIFLDPPWGGPNYCQGRQQQRQQGHRASHQHQQQHQTQKQERRQRQLQQQDQGNSAANQEIQGGRGGGAAAATMQLGGVPLSQLCVRLISKCGLLAIKLPSRCSDLQLFTQQVFAGMRGAIQQPGSHSHSAGEATAQHAAAAIMQFGRSSLVVFMHILTPTAAWLNSSEQQHQHIRQRHQRLEWLKVYRACLAQHQQRSASILSTAITGQVAVAK